MESVWDDPRPPRVEPSPARVVVELDGEVRTERLTPSTRRSSWCEFKGAARYYDAASHTAVAWSSPSPSPGYAAIAGHVGFSPGRVDAATVDGEQVEAQPGDFYGGWITSAVTGPFNGRPGAAGW